MSPGAAADNVSPLDVSPLEFRFADDGLVPNNPALPLLFYRGVLAIAASRDPAAAIEQVFAANGWGDMWRDGIYRFTHYHSMIHEALGIARGRANVRFGGPSGQAFEVEAGDVAVLPAGTGHCLISASGDLLVVGAYPPQGTYDLCRATPAEYARARMAIPKVALPPSDPIYGRDGPLVRMWHP